MILLDVDKVRSSDRYDNFDWWRTQRSRSRLRTKIDSNPRNRYTTAPLVINYANTIDLTEKAFLQANREHKNERDKRNLKLQINMRLMIMRKSSSLYSKGLIATGKQDQELGPWFTASSLGHHEEIKQPWFTASSLGSQLQQNNIYFTRKSRTK